MSEPFRLDVVTARDLCRQAEAWSEFRDRSEPEVPELIRGVWPAGTLGFISASPKAGKTWVALAMSLSIATGRPLFGAFEIITPGPVLYVAFEGARAGLRARISSLARGIGVDPDSDVLDENLHVLYKPRPFNLIDLEDADWLLSEAARTKAVLVVVDVLRQATRGWKENDAEAFDKVRDAVDPILAEGRSVALLHHFGKLSDLQRERSPGERMAGSGAIEGALDVGIYITKSESGARRQQLHFALRDGAASEPVWVAITGHGSGTHGGYTYTDTATFTVEPEAEPRDLAAEIEAYVREHPRSTTNDVAKGVSAGRTNVSEILKADERFAFEPGPNRARLWVYRSAETHPVHLFPPDPSGGVPRSGSPLGATLRATHPVGVPVDEDTYYAQLAETLAAEAHERELTYAQGAGGQS